MTQHEKHPTFLIADPESHSRSLLAEVLRAAGYFSIIHARDGTELLERTAEYNPRVIFVMSRFPGVSGLEFTRMIRAGFKDVARQTSIIVMTDTPTKAFLETAKESGVDEMLARPFSSQAIVVRLKSVLDHPRDFIDSAVYLGPCRRRRTVADYQGPWRRFIDPIEEALVTATWELESNRAVVRACVKKISELFLDLTPGDRRKLREVYFAVKETEAVADGIRDQMMGDAARSLNRYIMAVGASGDVDLLVLTTHIDAMHSLGVLTGQDHMERENLIHGLKRLVDKKLVRSKAA
ncbi:MAG: response regulator [Hyphomonadaceae bacterium]